MVSRYTYSGVSPRGPVWRWLPAYPTDLPVGPMSLAPRWTSPLYDEPGPHMFQYSGTTYRPVVPPHHESHGQCGFVLLWRPVQLCVLSDGCSQVPPLAAAPVYLKTPPVCVQTVLSVYFRLPVSDRLARL